jgi:hypothetical protein
VPGNIPSQRTLAHSLPSLQSRPLQKLICALIPFPTELRPRLPTIMGNVDYLTLHRRLEQIESLLQASGLEAHFVAQTLQDWLVSSRRRIIYRADTKNRSMGLA